MVGQALGFEGIFVFLAFSESLGLGLGSSVSVFLGLICFGGCIWGKRSGACD